MQEQRPESSVFHLLSVDPPTPQQLADAIVSPHTKSGLIGITYVGDVKQGSVFNTPIQGFPTEGDSFIVLNNGDAGTTPGTAVEFESQSLDGQTIPPGDPMGSPDGLVSESVVTLSLTFRLPAQPGRLSFDWKFGTEEIPTYQKTYKDYFRADVITESGYTNIALLLDNMPVTSFNMLAFANQPGGSSENPTPPFATPDDVTFNSVTAKITKSFFDLSPYGGQMITLAFRVANVLDSRINSGAFIDNVRIEGLEKRIDKGDAKNLLFHSIAFEELGIAHVINSEAEKIQYVLGTLEGVTSSGTPPTVVELLEVNQSVTETLKNGIKKEMLLQDKLENIIDIIVTPSIDVANYVSVDGGKTWIDANIEPGPTLVSPTKPMFKFVVTNTGNVNLKDVTLTDTSFGTITSGGIIPPGGWFEQIRLGTFASGKQTNTATATGNYGSQIVSDSDPVFYFGLVPDDIF